MSDMRFKVGDTIVVRGASEIKGDIMKVNEEDESYEVIWRGRTTEFDGDDDLSLDVKRK